MLRELVAGKSTEPYDLKPLLLKTVKSISVALSLIFQESIYSG